MNLTIQFSILKQENLDIIRQFLHRGLKYKVTLGQDFTDLFQEYQKFYDLH